MNHLFFSKKLGPHFLYKLYCFYFVVHFKSYTKAAPHLNLSASALVRNVQALESRLERSLFDKKTRVGLVLSAEGRRLFGYSTALLDLLHSLEQDLMDTGSAQPRTLLYSGAHLSALCDGLSAYFRESKFVWTEDFVQGLNQKLQAHLKDTASKHASKKRL